MSTLIHNSIKNSGTEYQHFRSMNIKKAQGFNQNDKSYFNTEESIIIPNVGKSVNNSFVNEHAVIEPIHSRRCTFNESTLVINAFHKTSLDFRKKICNLSEPKKISSKKNPNPLLLFDLSSMRSSNKTTEQDKFQSQNTQGNLSKLLLNSKSKEPKSPLIDLTFNKDQINPKTNQENNHKNDNIVIVNDADMLPVSNTENSNTKANLHEINISTSKSRNLIPKNFNIESRENVKIIQLPGNNHFFNASKRKSPKKIHSKLNITDDLQSSNVFTSLTLSTERDNTNNLFINGKEGYDSNISFNKLYLEKSFTQKTSSKQKISSRGFGSTSKSPFKKNMTEESVMPLTKRIPFKHYIPKHYKNCVILKQGDHNSRYYHNSNFRKNFDNPVFSETAPLYFQSHNNTCIPELTETNGNQATDDEPIKCTYPYSFMLTNTKNASLKNQANHSLYSIFRVKEVPDMNKINFKSRDIIDNQIGQKTEDEKLEMQKYLKRVAIVKQNFKQKLRKMHAIQETETIFKDNGNLP